MTDLCEWWPEQNRPAETAPTHGCPNVATLAVGAGSDNWHLCVSCADLPRFKRMTRRRPIRRSGGSALIADPKEQ